MSASGTTARQFTLMLLCTVTEDLSVTGGSQKVDIKYEGTRYCLLWHS